MSVYTTEGHQILFLASSLNPQVVVSYFISTSWRLYTIISEGKFTQPSTSFSINSGTKFPNGSAISSS